MTWVARKSDGVWWIYRVDRPRGCVLERSPMSYTSHQLARRDAAVWNAEDKSADGGES